MLKIDTAVALTLSPTPLPDGERGKVYKIAVLHFPGRGSSGQQFDL